MSNTETIENKNDYGIQYFNPIDFFIDKSFDDLNEIIKNEVISIDKIENTINTLKKNTDYTTIDTLILNETIRKNIIEKIDSYMYIYLLLLLSFKHDNDEIRKLLLKYSIINTFVIDTSIISLIINKSEIIQNFNTLIEHNIKSKSSKKDTLKFKHPSKESEATYLYNEYITNEDILILVSNKTKEYKHIILKIIILNIYQQQDKINIFKMLEVEELSQIEYTYIDVIDMVLDNINYSTIESLFKSDDVNVSKLSLSMYELLEENDEEHIISNDSKINELFKKNILIPITDEFLRYHKESEKYDKNVQVDKTNKQFNTNNSNKSNTKIKYIVSKINKVTDYYNIISKNNKNDISELDKLLYPPLIYRKAVIINEIEEQTIISKIIGLGNTLNTNEYYQDLLTYRKYPYINFKDHGRDSFPFELSDTKIAIRYCNFEFMNPSTYPTQYKNILQMRTAAKDMVVNIVGIAINPNKINNNRYGTTCVKLNKTLELDRNQSNGYLSTISVLKKQISQDLTFNKLPYWIFNRKNDTIKIKSYENLSSLNHEEYYKFLLSKIYDELLNETYQKIISVLNSTDIDDMYILKQIINNVEESLINIKKTSYYDDIFAYIYYNKIGKYNEFKYDINENKIPGLNSKLIKIPTYKNVDYIDAKIVLSKEEFLLGKVIEEIIDEEFEIAICQHQLTWKQINYYKKKDTNKFKQLLFDFIKKYSFDAGNHDDFICKSCYESLDIKKYMADSFDSKLNNITLVVPLEADLEQLPEYEKFNRAIKNMDKFVERISSISNIQYYLGNMVTNKYRRQTIIKNTIDIITQQTLIYDVRNINMKKERLNNSNKLYGIDMTKSSYFIFEMDNNIFTFSSKDVDKFKKYKNNNIFLYIIFFIISEFNFNQIINLTYDKLINYTIFDKFSINLFDNLKIRIDNGTDIRPITNYKLLCYVIYYMCSMLIKYNIWFSSLEVPSNKSNTINPQLQKNIINTIIDLINSVLEVNTRKNKNFIYEYIASKFLIKLKTIYDNK